MKISELEDGEYFMFNGNKWKRCKRIPRHTAGDCMEVKSQRHRPFAEKAEVEPCQNRLEV